MWLHLLFFAILHQNLILLTLPTASAEASECISKDEFSKWKEEMEKKTEEMEKKTAEMEKKTEEMENKVEEQETHIKLLNKLMNQKQDFVGFSATHNQPPGQNLYDNGDTIIFETEIYDGNSNYDVTSGVFTCPVGGLYQFSASITGADQTIVNFCINVGGVDTGCTHVTGTGGGASAAASAVIACSQSQQVQVISRRDGSRLLGFWEGIATSSFSGVLIGIDA